MELNNVTVFGRVVRDAELKVDKNNLKRLIFSIANNRKRKNSFGEYENTAYFFPITIFGDYAEKMQAYLVKGQKVIVEGFLRQDKWEKEGKKFDRISIGVNKLHLVFDSKSKNENTIDEEEMSSEIVNFIEEQEDSYENFEIFNEETVIEEDIY